MNLSKSEAEKLWEYPQYKKVKVKLKNGNVTEVARYGTMGFHDKDGNYYDFYEVEFVNPKDEQ